MVERNHFVYIVECRDGSYYTGYTTNPSRRLAVHESGRGAKYTRARRPLKLVYTKAYRTKQEAMQAEYMLKQKTKRQKAQLIAESEGVYGTGSELYK
ncbi:putative endonuclease [Salsuginibacillus halophilus]|uniref:Putative endonuclease n=1 Tax=Salsuginibacillus halophilus TaxID=517424 RepID=A0A2P8H7M7_9BACI|nr:GIY-YIG nuclease family protein [Salsuginibacillus halophilus]PSL42237.1 putative endonuclease [Salsuginibacillus halophilus]